MKKKEIREEVKIKRQKLTASQNDKLSTQIRQRLLDEFNLEGKFVSIFLPIAKQNEINTYPFLELSSTLNIHFCLTKSNFEDLSMTHYLYIPETELVINAYGIPEPFKDVNFIKNDQLDFVIVPLLAHSAEGYRVGYGKGFYDRLLKCCKSDCKFIGLDFFDDSYEIDDIDQYDIKLHFCVTPNNIIAFEKI
jgi:5-formyltetrahydrofolate cyclo-ligase